MLQSDPLLAKFRCDTAENELSEVGTLTILTLLMNWDECANVGGGHGSLDLRSS